MVHNAISVVTAVFNCQETIGDALSSVAMQTVQPKEHIVQNGVSTDATTAVVEASKSPFLRHICEPDAGLYDALNKGVGNTQGDVVGFLHADDMLHSTNTLSLIQSEFEDLNVDAVYGDLLYVDASDTSKVIRYWRSGAYKPSRFRYGWMPPHPTVYVRKSLYEKFGGYRTDFGSAADYEWLVRLMVKNNICVRYIPEILVRMRVGGASNASLGHRMLANKSDREAWSVNDLRPPWALRLTKPLRKLPQYVLRPPAGTV